MDNLKAEYNKWHQDQAELESEMELDLSRWHDEAVLLYENVNGKKLLEIGCGRGDFSLLLNERGAIVTGTDFSESAIAIAKHKSNIRGSLVDFKVADAENLPFDSLLFDLIFSCECLEHIPNPQNALNEMFRVVKPGGSVILTTENYSNGMLIQWMKSWLTGKPFNSGTKVQPIEISFCIGELLE